MMMMMITMMMMMMTMMMMMIITKLTCTVQPSCSSSMSPCKWITCEQNIIISEYDDDDDDDEEEDDDDDYDQEGPDENEDQVWIQLRSDRL